MATEKTLAIVLRVVEFSETSSIVTLFTREFGKIGGMAKGARRPKSAFEFALDLLAVCRIVFIHKSTDTLDLLTEAKLERRFRGADRGLAYVYAGYYIAELLQELTDQNDPHPDLFDLAVQTLGALGSGQALAPSVLRFEMVALDLLGHLPSLQSCAECGRKMEPAARVPFGLISGGVLCGRCRPGRSNVVQVSSGVLEAFRCFAAADDQWKTFPLERAVWGELRAVLNRFLQHLLGHELNLHSVLQTFFNVPNQAPSAIQGK